MKYIFIFLTIMLIALLALNFSNKKIRPDLSILRQYEIILSLNDYYIKNDIQTNNEFDQAIKSTLIHQTKILNDNKLKTNQCYIHKKTMAKQIVPLIDTSEQKITISNLGIYLKALQSDFPNSDEPIFRLKYPNWCKKFIITKVEEIDKFICPLCKHSKFIWLQSNLNHQ